MVKYSHYNSYNHKRTTLLYIFITDSATPERNTTAIRKTTVGTSLLQWIIIALILIYIMMTKASADNYET